LIKNFNLKNLNENYDTDEQVEEKYAETFFGHDDSKKRKLLKCSFPGCDMTYSRINFLNLHEKSHFEENTIKNYQCKICLRNFNEKGNLKTHERTHTGERPYKCTYEGCESAFKTSGHLAEHFKIHNNSRPFKCNFCNGSFSRLSTLRTHLKSSFHKDVTNYDPNEEFYYEDELEFYSTEDLQVEKSSLCFISPCEEEDGNDNTNFISNIIFVNNNEEEILRDYVNSDYKF
jgi:uncharacterized Zn-finger protein